LGGDESQDQDGMCMKLKKMTRKKEEKVNEKTNSING